MEFVLNFLRSTSELRQINVSVINSCIFDSGPQLAKSMRYF